MLIPRNSNITSTKSTPKSRCAIFVLFIMFQPQIQNFVTHNLAHPPKNIHTLHTLS
ncbi:hypothetical protein FD50_GL000306 [Liquorilactobacillus satsumensis DSM 16230 = JCM 12392]|uniref:Uncharacterized protein n=1 Tax=Liquorilactobacillus satsumensis DSM 16230 = JCM 12392 TaxID=1423801 RepID=A0A0R1V089_9LACO|nr:hypothetical protein FD50_GL000306 [Liquorilactobacillus satsumensis DSM 16230 = JCM 12392]